MGFKGSDIDPGLLYILSHPSIGSLDSPPGAGAAVGSLDGQAIATFQPVSVIPWKVAKRLPECNPAPDGRVSGTGCRGLPGSGATGPAGKLPSLPRPAHPNQRLLGGKPGLGSLGRRPPRRRRQARSPRAEPPDTDAARGSTAADAAGPGFLGRPHPTHRAVDWRALRRSPGGLAGGALLGFRQTQSRTAARGEGFFLDPERHRSLHFGTPAGGGTLTGAPGLPADPDTQVVLRPAGPAAPAGRGGGIRQRPLPHGL